MLISSITLGVFSDKYGRLRCIKFGFVISVLANLAAILAHDYYLFCASILLMSYAQVGAANALNTLRKYRLATSDAYLSAPRALVSGHA